MPSGGVSMAGEELGLGQRNGHQYDALMETLQLSPSESLVIDDEVEELARIDAITRAGTRWWCRLGSQRYPVRATAALSAHVRVRHGYRLRVRRRVWLSARDGLRIERTVVSVLEQLLGVGPRLRRPSRRRGTR